MKFCLFFPNIVNRVLNTFLMETQLVIFQIIPKVELSIYFEEWRLIPSHWHDFLKQYAGHRLSADCPALSLLPSSWLFTRHTYFLLVARSAAYYQTSQTGLNLFFPLTLSNRESLLSVRLPRLPQMTCWWFWPLSGQPAKLLRQDFSLLCIRGDLRTSKTAAKDYSRARAPWHAYVRFCGFLLQMPSSTNS